MRPYRNCRPKKMKKTSIRCGRGYVPARGHRQSIRKKDSRLFREIRQDLAELRRMY